MLQQLTEATGSMFVACSIGFLPSVSSFSAGLGLSCGLIYFTATESSGVSSPVHGKEDCRSLAMAHLTGLNDSSAITSMGFASRMTARHRRDTCTVLKKEPDRFGTFRARREEGTVSL